MTFDIGYLKEAENYPTLGPAYFDSRKVSQELLEKYGEQDMKEVAQKAADDLYIRLLESFENHFLSDTENNIRGHITRMVDNTVTAILGGNQWAIDKYVMGKYDCEKVRSSLASLVSKELKDKRVEDLEKENKRLTESLRVYQDRY